MTRPHESRKRLTFHRQIDHAEHQQRQAEDCSHQHRQTQLAWHEVEATAGLSIESPGVLTTVSAHQARSEDSAAPYPCQHLIGLAITAMILKITWTPGGRCGGRSH